MTTSLSNEGYSMKPEISLEGKNIQTCGVDVLVESLKYSSKWLEQHRERINRLNVFPVPDGDTGDNMLMTMLGAVRAIEEQAPTTMAALADALEEGALMASRGNSGVILSQMIAGFASVIRGFDSLDVRILAEAFKVASEYGFRAHSEPVEGTMMTVARDIAKSAHQAARNTNSIIDFLSIIIDDARESVKATQYMLPKLQQAGVVDAGGEGLVVILDGALRYFKGELLEINEDSFEGADFASVDLEEEDIYGYCTNFVLRGHNIDVEEFRSKMQSMGTSVLVVGTPAIVKVHVHTEQPGEVLSYALKFGTLHQIKLDNMGDQYEQNVLHTRTHPSSQITTGLVIVAAGQGFTRMLQREDGVIVVQGGQTMNPSTGEIIKAVRECPADAVIILPNNPNIIMSAERAVGSAGKRVEVVPTKSMAEGIVASMAYNPSLTLEENLENIRSAIRNVRSIEVTRAVRDAQVKDVSVKEGDYIGLLDGQIVASGADLSDVMRHILETIEDLDEYELITLYRGHDLSQRDVESLAEFLKETFPDIAVEVYDGGQPHYQIIASLE